MAFGGLALRNAQVTSGGAGEHSTPAWLARAVDAGVDFVIVSPTRSDVPAGMRARWIPIRPNTDAAMMLGMLHTLLTANLHDKAFVQSHCVGTASPRTPPGPLRFAACLRKLSVSLRCKRRARAAC